MFQRPNCSGIEKQIWPHLNTTETSPSAFHTLRAIARPDVVIGAKATDDAGWLWTTNARDFFKAFPLLEVLTPPAFLTPYAPAPPPHER
jgi:hypothetical protein